MSMLKMCLNPKVVVGLALAAVGIYVVAPGLLVAALPVLLLAACPLSMLFMGRAMMGGHQQSSAQARPPERASADEMARLRSEVNAPRARLPQDNESNAEEIELRRVVD